MLKKVWWETEMITHCCAYFNVFFYATKIIICLLIFMIKDMTGHSEKA